jgi:formylglycine-generating enzyme required for sulfatase activity
MAKYPITCAQFQVFVDAADGFHNPKWWEGLAAGQDHKKQPGEQRFKVNDHPREHASWYDAVAFCRWLTAQLFPFPPSLRSWPEKGSGDDGWEIRLPTEWEWQWAAQGSDGREYPWGNGFDKSKCNTGESSIGRTTPVDNYPSGASPFGVMDMAGNVWEWCLNEYENPENIGLTGDGPRVVRGGSWFYDQYDARAVFRFSWYPAIRDNRHGFRVVVFAPTHK